MGTYAIREEGKNGSVEIQKDRIVRTRKKHVGKDDIQTIPIAAITGVSHDRKTVGTDQVHLQVGSVTYQWKVSSAERMVAELHDRMFSSESSSVPPSPPPAAAAQLPPAGWHPDPHGAHEMRYWDGATWTDHVSSGGVQSQDLRG